MQAEKGIAELLSLSFLFSTAVPSLSYFYWGYPYSRPRRPFCFLSCYKNFLFVVENNTANYTDATRFCQTHFLFLINKYTLQSEKNLSNISNPCFYSSKDAVMSLRIASKTR